MPTTVARAQQIVSIAADSSDTTLDLQLQLDRPVRLPASTPHPDDLFGFIDFDTDADGSTGVLSTIDFLTATRPELATRLGVDRQLDLGSHDARDSTVALVDAIDQTVLARVPVSVEGDELRLEIDHSSLGTDFDGTVRFAAVVGDAAEVTDTHPPGGHMTTEPASGTALHDGRFHLTVEWRDFAGTSGVGTPVTTSSDSALLWFFQPENWELLVKVLDGCSANGQFWVFVAATTNVEFTVRIQETPSGVVRLWRNELGQPPLPVQEIEAFPCS